MALQGFRRMMHNSRIFLGVSPRKGALSGSTRKRTEPRSVSAPRVTILHASFYGRRRGQVLRGQPLGAPQGQSARPWLAALRPHHSRRFSLRLAHPALADGQGCSSSCNRKPKRESGQ